MKELRVIIETLKYVQDFRDSIIFIKLGGKIIGRAKELGIIKDICLLKKIGINIIVALNSNDVDKDQWKNPECSFQYLDIETAGETHKYLSQGKIPVIHCLHTKSMSSDKTIATLSGKLRSNKLIYVTDREGVFDNKKQLIREASVNSVRELIASKAVTSRMKEKLESAIKACELGVYRVHIISGFKKGSLLKEIFSCDGVGTMIYSVSPYTNIRKAKPEDIGNIFDILKSSLTTSINYADISSKIENFYVFTVDEQIHGCVMMEENTESGIAELIFAATSPSYESSEAIKELIEYIIQKEVSRKIKKIILEPEKNSIWLGLYPWFLQLGFKKEEEEKEQNKAWIKSLK